MHMDMRKMMKEAQKMQAQLERAQEEIKTLEVEASAGGGMVKVKVTGDMFVKEIIIDPEVIDPDDVEMLQDMVCAAVNEGIRAAQGLANSRISSVTGGMNLPGLM
ncbi:MAG: YbaB/EbfC family nucleoid-associated protein [Actinobacteria bacterium]|nr:YbaB/EbfC family nucleoid-associated protein [Actinomycetota bacterium]